MDVSWFYSSELAEQLKAVPEKNQGKQKQDDTEGPHHKNIGFSLEK